MWRYLIGSGMGVRTICAGESRLEIILVATMQMPAFAFLKHELHFIKLDGQRLQMAKQSFRTNIKNFREK